MNIGWQGSSEEFNSIKGALDPQSIGQISRVLFLSWARTHFSAPETLPQTSEPDTIGSNALITDWNGMFWEILQDKTSDVTQGLSLAHMMKEFRSAAETIARSVVEELLQHPATLTAIDPPSPQHSRLGYTDCPLFVQNGLCALAYHPSTQVLTKTLAHDLRSSRVFHGGLSSMNSNSVAIPVQCIVDYMGIRVLVIAEILNSKPCVLTSDAATTVRQVLHALHTCELTDSLDQIVPFDTHVTEAHGRIVLTKLRNLCAPDILNEPDDQSALCAWKLRPEYIRQYHTPLYSNVYRSQNGDQHENIVACASHYLQKSIIPACVHQLESKEYIHLVDSEAITTFLHRQGINMRYLGRLYELSTMKHVRRLLLTEMVARAAKVLLRAMLREGPSHWRAIAVDFFNVLCGSGSESIAFYANEVIPTVDLKFGILLKDCRQDLHLPQLFVALQYHTGAHFGGNYPLSFDQSPYPFRSNHIQSLEPAVTVLCKTTAACEAMTTSTNWNDVGLESALTNVKLALALEQAFPSDHRHIHLCHLLVMAAEICQALGESTDAETFAMLALEEGPSQHVVTARANIVLMQLYHEKEDLQSAILAFEKAVEITTWHMGPTHPFLCQIILQMSIMLEERQDWQKALQYMEQCTAVVKEAYGRHTLQFAECRCKQGELLRSLGLYDQALSMFEDAYHIYEGLSSCLKESADCCSKMTELLMDMHSYQPAYNMAMKAHSLYQDCSPNQEENILSSWMQLGTCSVALNDDFRALECYKSALGIVKSNLSIFQNAVHRIQEISRHVLTLAFRTLSPESKQCLENIKKKKCQQEISSNILAFVVAQMYSLDVPEYLEMIFHDLVRDTDEESIALFQEYSSEMQLRGILQLLEK